MTRNVGREFDQCLDYKIREQAQRDAKLIEEADKNYIIDGYILPSCSLDDVQKVEGLLASKHNLSGLLPDSHPYHRTRLEDIKERKGLYDYEVCCDENNEAYYTFEPVKSLPRIILKSVITGKGVTFAELIGSLEKPKYANLAEEFAYMVFTRSEFLALIVSTIDSPSVCYTNAKAFTEDFKDRASEVLYLTFHFKSGDKHFSKSRIQFGRTMSLEQGLDSLQSYLDTYLLP